MSSNPALNRVFKLLDQGSFQQILTGVEQYGAEMPRKAGDGVFAGFGRVNGREISVAAHDPTFAGGSLGEVGLRKIAKLYELATRFGIPIIVLADSSGARLQEGARSLLAVGELVKQVSAAHGKIPQINVIFGGAVGGAAFNAAFGDIVIGVGKTGYMFLHGPRAVKHALGQDVSVMELGSVKSLSETSGMIHFIVQEEDEAITLVKTLLSYLPSNHNETPPVNSFPYQDSETADHYVADTNASQRNHRFRHFSRTSTQLRQKHHNGARPYRWSRCRSCRQRTKHQ